MHIAAVVICLALQGAAWSAPAEELVLLTTPVGQLAFDAKTFALVEVSGPSGVNTLSTPHLPSFWSANVVVQDALPGTTVTIDGTTPCAQAFFMRPSTDSLAITWQGLTVPGLKSKSTIDVTATVAVMRTAFTITLSWSSTASDFALWEWGFQVGPVATSSDAHVIQNSGFGLVSDCTLGCPSFNTQYPQGTFQFLALYNSTRGLYVAAHDPHADSKSFGAKFSDDAGVFSITAIAAGAGSPSATGASESFPFALQAFSGDWWDAAQIYRAFVLAEADWTRMGPLRNRTDLPPWLLNVTTWVNSHWQQNDIFNITGGDPEVVLNRVSAIVERFQLPSELGLHWYEWDELGYAPGSNYTECTSEITCGLTHITRNISRYAAQKKERNVRDGFEATVTALQNLGVRVAPYINGRIFDVATKSWADDSAEKFAAKSADPSLSPTELKLYYEQYGSEAQFAVMCPHTDYWQSKLAGVVEELITTYHTDGVYIDQIAAAGPRPCWDPSHNHTLGGGDHWVTGYRALLNAVRASAGPKSVILTESNAEPFMDGINIFLTLVGFSSPPAGPTHSVPLFPAVYGGYYVSMGAEFFQNDFAPNPNVFAAKLAHMFLFGAQLGWFSLGGRNNQNPAMGIYDNLMDEAYDAEVAYLRLLASAKLRVNAWLYGQALRIVPLTVNGSSNPVVPDPNYPFSVVMSGAWWDPVEMSLGIFVTTPQRDVAAQVEIAIPDLTQFGFGSATAASTFSVALMSPDGGPDVPLPSVTGLSFTYTTTVTPRSVLLLRVTQN